MRNQQAPPSPDKKKPSDNGWMSYTTLAFQIVAAMVFFIFVGYLLDKWLGMQFPLFKMIGSVVGVAATMVILFRLAGKSK